jgi:hypothetical protein
VLRREIEIGIAAGNIKAETDPRAVATSIELFVIGATRAVVEDRNFDARAATENFILMLTPFIAA